jgi:hypothetical protein
MLERGKQLLRTILFKTMDCYAQQINKDTDRLKKKLIGIFFFTKIKKEEYGWQKKKKGRLWESGKSMKHYIQSGYWTY